MQTAHLEVKLDLPGQVSQVICDLDCPRKGVQSVVNQVQVKLIATASLLKQVCLSERQLPSDYLRAQQPQQRCPVSPVSPSQTPTALLR